MNWQDRAETIDRTIKILCPILIILALIWGWQSERVLEGLQELARVWGL